MLRMSSSQEALRTSSPIGIRCDVTSLMGDISVASKVIARIKDETGVNLPQAAIFTHPTVEKMSNMVREITLCSHTDGI